MYNEEVLAEDKEQAIQDALVQMKDDEQGLAILQEVLGTDAMIAFISATMLPAPGAGVSPGPEYSETAHPSRAEA